MAKSKKTHVIDRVLTVSFSQKEPSDRELKARLQEILDNGTFDTPTKMAKHYLGLGLEAEAGGLDAGSPETPDFDFASVQEIRLKLAELGDVVKDLRSQFKTFDKVEQETNSLRRALIHSVSTLLAQWEWTDQEVNDWVRDVFEWGKKPAADAEFGEGS